MAQERLTVRKIKEILRLKYEAELSNRAIAGACKVSNSTVGDYIRRAKATGISWPVGEVDEQELYEKLFPEKKKKESPERPMPNWEEVQKEIRQKGGNAAIIVAGIQGKIPGRLSIFAILLSFSGMEKEPGRTE